jgi:preprotein translocase subunit SecB
MSDAGQNSAGDNGNNEDAPRFQIVAQYTKDLSFENPSAPANPNTRPQVDMGVDLQARQVDKELYEVEMKLRVSATVESKPAFLLELAYGGLFMLHNIPDEVRTQVLLIEAPHIMFPFVRRIIADTVRDGGLPPLMIEPIDFAALYRAKAAELQQQQQSGEESKHLDA